MRLQYTLQDVCLQGAPIYTLHNIASLNDMSLHWHVIVEHIDCSDYTQPASLTLSHTETQACMSLYHYAYTGIQCIPRYRECLWVASIMLF